MNKWILLSVSSHTEPADGALAPCAPVTRSTSEELQSTSVAPLTNNLGQLPANRGREKREHKGESREICEYCKSAQRGDCQWVPASMCACVK